jgi:hypothetical protein
MLTRRGRAPIPPQMRTLLGCDMAELAGVLKALGFRVEEGADGPLLAKGKRPRGGPAKRQPREPLRGEAASPFAALRQHGSPRP